MQGNDIYNAATNPPFAYNPKAVRHIGLLRTRARMGRWSKQRFGNARKDIVPGPGRFNFDTSLYKTFKIHESTNFEFRAESFNTFNHTEFNNVGSSFGNSTFGQPTTTWDPRVLQFGAKLNF